MINRHYEKESRKDTFSSPEKYFNAFLVEEIVPYEIIV